MARNYIFILTDSGEIQEEAHLLKKLVIVLRDTTERLEEKRKNDKAIGNNEATFILNLSAYKKIYKEQNKQSFFGWLCL